MEEEESFLEIILHLIVICYETLTKYAANFSFEC